MNPLSLGGYTDAVMTVNVGDDVGVPVESLSRPTFRKNYLYLVLEAGLSERTQPAAPRST